MNNIFKSGIALLVALSASVVALPVAASGVGTKTVTVNAVGYGASEESAIRSALSQAVAQVNGTSLTSSQATSSNSLTGVVSNARGESESVNMEVKSEISAKTETSGFVHSYEVLEMTPNESGYKASVKAKVYRYDLPSSSKRKRLAIPATTHSQNSYFVFKTYSGNSLAKLVHQEIESELVQARKFAVLSRQELGAVKAELALISSDLTSREDKAKTGRLLGADFILLSNIESATGTVTEKTIQVTGQVQKTASASIRLNVKVIAAATGEIKFSETYNAYTGTESSARIIKSVAQKAVRDTVERIYPALIVSADESRVGLNAGGRSVVVGDLFKVYSKGESIFDPYTGESLGAEESYIGKIEITKVLPKMSYAKTINGGPFEVGMVVRRAGHRAAKKSNSAQPAVAKPTTGYKLPFDQ